jgi:hypothetical protein
MIIICSAATYICKLSTLVKYKNKQTIRSQIYNRHKIVTNGDICDRHNVTVFAISKLTVSKSKQKSQKKSQKVSKKVSQDQTYEASLNQPHCDGFMLKAVTMRLVLES